MLEFSSTVLPAPSPYRRHSQNALCVFYEMPPASKTCDAISRVNSDSQVELLCSDYNFAWVETDREPDIIITCQRVADSTQYRAVA